MSTGRRTMVVAAVFVAGVALAGCAESAESTGMSTRPSASASATTPTPEPSASQTPPAADEAGAPAGAPADDDGRAGESAPTASDHAPEPGADPVAADAPPRCVDEQLTGVYETRGDVSGMGKGGFQIVLTNVSDAPCGFTGRPGLVAEDAAGARLGMPATSLGGTAEPVVLEPGASSVAVGTYANVRMFDCEAVTTAALRAFITSDGAGPGIRIPAEIEVCADGSGPLALGMLGNTY